MIDPGGPPSVTDADGDGLIDQFEQLFGTDTTKADTDGDGLSDAYENVGQPHGRAVDRHRSRRHDRRPRAGRGHRPRAWRGAGLRPRRPVRRARLPGQRQRRRQRPAGQQKAGTNALDADTDHDGLKDGVEAAHGSNALSIDSDSDGLTDSFESAAGTLEPAAQAGVPGGGNSIPGGWGARGALGAGGRRVRTLWPAGADPLAPGAAPDGACLADLAH